MDNYENNNSNNYNIPEEPKGWQQQSAGAAPNQGWQQQGATQNQGWQQPNQNWQATPQPGYTYNHPGAPTYAAPGSPQAKAKKGLPGWAKALIIIACVLLFAVLMAAACSKAVNNFLGESVTEDYTYLNDYIGVVYLTGTITDGESGDGYNQSWILNRIDDMAEDSLNKGLVLYIETPGGSAYASRDLYLDLLYYKEQTGRPVYVYMGSQATSGGYYVSMAADKIYAHEECWTGSIGVIIGSLYDFSGLMEKYGVKAENITSGSNKDIGTYIKPMTDEQRQILQSLVDDSFDRFVQAVVDGRKLPEAKVRELADGRIYSANQALEHGLIDAIGTIDDTVADMQEAYGLEGADPEFMQYNPPADLRSYLGFDSLLSNNQSEKSDLDALFSMLEKQQTYELLCIAPIKK